MGGWQGEGRDVVSWDGTLKAKGMIGESVQVTGDDTDGNAANVVNIVFGTSATPPTASTVPIGTIYIQYTA